MCIILYKPENKNFPSNKTLVNCFQNNPDGAGFAIRYPSGKILIDKGYMTARSFFKRLKTIPSNFAVCIHFRLGTSGGISPEKCHPFPVTSNDILLNSLYYFTDTAIAHNGILGQGSKRMSDTQLFVRDELAPIKNKLFDGDIQKAIVERLNGSNKIIIMSIGKRPVIYGKWKEDSGIYYSNDGYKYNSLISEAMRFNYWRYEKNQFLFKEDDYYSNSYEY